MAISSMEVLGEGVAGRARTVAAPGGRLAHGNGGLSAERLASKAKEKDQIDIKLK